MSKKSDESCVKNLNANDFTEGNSSKETDDSDVSVLKRKTVKDTFSEENENVALHVGAKKRQKLHWGYLSAFKLVSISATNVNIS